MSVRGPPHPNIWSNVTMSYEQVQGKTGISDLMAKRRASGFSVFYHGALAASAATFAVQLITPIFLYVPRPETLQKEASDSQRIIFIISGPLSLVLYVQFSRRQPA